jgi:hypothetical protein
VQVSVIVLLGQQLITLAEAEAPHLVLELQDQVALVVVVLDQ